MHNEKYREENSFEEVLKVKLQMKNTSVEHIYNSIIALKLRPLIKPIVTSSWKQLWALP